MRDGRAGFETGRLLERRIRRRGWIKLWSGLGFLAAVACVASWYVAPHATGDIAASVVDRIRQAGRAATAAASTASPERPTAVEPAAVLRSAHAVKTTSGAAHSARDVQCLALAIYHEAGSGPAAERELVGQVALNRAAASSPRKPLCTVVYLGLGRPHGCLFKRTCRNIGQLPVDAVLWGEAVAIAERMAAGEALKPELGEASHFRLKTEAAPWAAGVFALTEVGRFKVYSAAPVDPAGRPQAGAGGMGGATETAAMGGEPPPKPVVRKPPSQIAKRSDTKAQVEPFAPFDRLAN